MGACSECQSQSIEFYFRCAMERLGNQVSNFGVVLNCCSSGGASVNIEEDIGPSDRTSHLLWIKVPYLSVHE